MQKFAFITATVLGLSAATSFAQAPTEPSPLPKAPPEVSAEAPPPPPPPPPGPRGGPGKDMAPGHHHPPPKGAHFRVVIGDARINLKCADDEPQKACADLLLQIIDRANAADGNDDDRNNNNDRGRRYERDRYDRR